MTYICVSILTIIGSDHGLSPGRRQAIIWTNAGISLIAPLGTNFSEILIEIQSFSFKKTRLKMSSGKWRPFCLGLNVLNTDDKLQWNFNRNLNFFLKKIHFKMACVLCRPHCVNDLSVVIGYTSIQLDSLFLTNSLCIWWCYLYVL